MSHWDYPASGGLQSTNIHGMEQGYQLVIEGNQEKRKLTRGECRQCSVKQATLLCHDITAFPNH